MLVTKNISMIEAGKHILANYKSWYTLCLMIVCKKIMLLGLIMHKQQ